MIFLRKNQNKYHNKKTEVNGVLFDSKKEANRYQELLFLYSQGKISHLELQPRFPFIINEKKICTYVADFIYLDKDKNCYIVEDVKGFKTDVYKIKSKLFKAIYSDYTFIES